MYKRQLPRVLIAALLTLSSFRSFSQDEKAQRSGRFYFSWGYNHEAYSTSNIHIVQPALGNDYVFNNTVAHDKIGWNQLFSHDLTIPQYNYRIGYFYNDKWAIELNFDHTKYVVTEGQAIRVTGKMGDLPVDMQVVTGDSVLLYQLNNGANFFLFNIVRRLQLCASSSGKAVLDLLGKAGVGPVVPHVQNTIFGKDNVPHFQFGGWNTGLEAALKATFFHHAYLEFCGKLDYASYSGLRIYEGTAAHHFTTRELVLNLGYTFPMGKKVQK